jgi:two-component system LytT family sensor kinase
MKPINFWNTRLIFLIPLVGLLILSMFLLSFGIKDTDIIVRQVIFSILNTTFIWLGCVFIVQYLWKKYPWEHHPVKHLVYEVVLIFIYTITVSGLIYYLSLYFWNMPIISELGAAIFITLLITYLITGIHEGVFFYQQWKLNFSKSARLERDNIEARYAALRTQLNPHFLFNSLNSLSALVENNRQATDYIQHMSDLMRYMLRGNEKELVLLRDELSVLNSYIYLQKIRFGEALIVKLQVDDRHFHYAVPTLSLQMLVENAIKHNIATIEKPLIVELGISDKYIFVKNNLQLKKIENTSGHGLNNIIARYRQHSSRSVIINQNTDYFQVNLPLLILEL